MRCTHWRRVPLDLMREARERSAAECVDRAVQCQLAPHDDGEHHGLLGGDLDEYGTALWLRWRGGTEVELVVLPDCPVVAPGPDGEGCCLFAGHAGRHTWDGTADEAPCTG
ncbi:MULTISPECIES: hypothetical protein [Streptomyces]|uniref:hypothetical protein n=1 Tax=Streptomyces TaxID=1883 RepID=UPI0009FD8892|nr:hypothetical protein [Streptomyces sp. MOE7]ARH91748.1 hypothetical protein STRMOE7_17180 [Streptomyces sp. MOE7]